MKPFVVLVRNAPAASAPTVVAALRATPGISGAAAPRGWTRPGAYLVEAFPSVDGDAKAIVPTITKLRRIVLPSIERRLDSASTASTGGASVALGGLAAEDRDFVVAVYSNFPYVLGFVVLITYILLARAFRSLILPLKAVVLNLVSLAAAFGIIVFIFQEGHGSMAIWGVAATQSIIPWIPLMIFAFLFGLSMDYEVFMLTRIREAYDETHDTRQAVALGLARTGKLVTSAALILMFAFFVLSSAPSLDVKQFGIGLAAGIIFDATVIRALLVPALVRLLGRWNWWMPAPAARLLLLKKPAPGVPTPAP
jgi:RND superfamily putative drug exporter